MTVLENREILLDGLQRRTSSVPSRIPWCILRQIEQICRRQNRTTSPIVVGFDRTRITGRDDRAGRRPSESNVNIDRRKGASAVRRESSEPSLRVTAAARATSCHRCRCATSAACCGEGTITIPSCQKSCRWQVSADRNLGVEGIVWASVSARDARSIIHTHLIMQQPRPAGRDNQNVDVTPAATRPR